MVTIFKTANTSSLTGLPKVRRDVALLSTDIDNGMKFAFDLGWNWSWPTLAAPVNGAVVHDMAEVGDGSVDYTTTGVTYAGGGWDFTGIGGDYCALKAPACLGSIWSGPQYFMVAAWVKLPSSANWNSTGTIKSLFAASVSQYNLGTDLLTLAEVATGKTINARRQTNGATTADLTVAPDANQFGQVCQLAYWRNAAGTGLRLKSALGQKLATGAVGADNVGNFSALQPQWGAPVAFSPNDKGRLYRGWIEDLQVSGRNPLTVLDADFAATIARGVFS